MICSRCHEIVVMVRRHPDCSCNPASAELVEAEQARLARGARLLVRSGSFWRQRDTQGTGGHSWGILTRAERYDEPPPRGPDAEPWDVVPEDET